ncbi:MAG TPA: LUD domain-containing protein [Edaphocola sp.]|nr:LUD domain-containing protein [Edaphocola sp.]
MPTKTTSKAKENILRKIRTALQEEKAAKPYDDEAGSGGEVVFQPLSMPSLEESFALEFNKSGGFFAFCNGLDELAENLRQLALQKKWLEVMCADKDLFTVLIDKKLSFIREYNVQNNDMPACITNCEAAIARTGSMIFSSRQHYGRSASIYFPVHIVVLRPEQIVEDIGDGLALLKKKYKGHLPSMINLNTGPSRTADIEKTLVKGIHGPKEVFCFLVNV